MVEHGMGEPSEEVNGERLLSIWHLDGDQLFEMSPFERDQIFDERTNRLHDALIAQVEGATADQLKEILDKDFTVRGGPATY
ncbi:MAG TPA: hypothetical protein VFB03_01995 [Candidatus Saccharimonadales bacterium]|nr:hypothetical protein [Candidatus Saccharimonadales bacterium]